MKKFALFAVCALLVSVSIADAGVLFRRGFRSRNVVNVNVNSGVGGASFNRSITHFNTFHGTRTFRNVNTFRSFGTYGGVNTFNSFGTYNNFVPGSTVIFRQFYSGPAPSATILLDTGSVDPNAGGTCGNAGNGGVTTYQLRSKTIMRGY